MLRLTFGVSSSPFVATKVLHQLAADHRIEYPEASQVILNTFYVDDCLSGAHTIEQAIVLRQQLCDLQDGGGMV